MCFLLEVVDDTTGLFPMEARTLVRRRITLPTICLVAEARQVKRQGPPYPTSLFQDITALVSLRYDLELPGVPEFSELTAVIIYRNTQANQAAEFFADGTSFLSQ